MKIMNNGRMLGGIFISLYLFGCAASREFATTTPQNLFDRSSIEIKDYKFFRAANPDDFTSCVTHLNAMCERREMDAGESFDALEFSVAITDRHAGVEEPIHDYSMYLAGLLSNKLGYDYFTAIGMRNIGTCSTTPSARSSGRVDSSGYYYGTTTVANDAVCSNVYTATYLAFKNYAPIKSGILVKYSEDGKPEFRSDLYFNMADLIKATKSASPDVFAYFIDHPIEPWKDYFPSGKTIQAAVAKYSLLPKDPNIMAIVKRKLSEERATDLRKELIIRVQ